jgi:hypothetical protein
MRWGELELGQGMQQPLTVSNLLDTNFLEHRAQSLGLVLGHASEQRQAGQLLLLEQREVAPRQPQLLQHGRHMLKMGSAPGTTISGSCDDCGHRRTPKRVTQAGAAKPSPASGFATGYQGTEEAI